MSATEAHQFMDMVFGAAPDDTYILIWTLDRTKPGNEGKVSAWFQDSRKAADYALENAGNATIDVYVGAALSPKDYGPKRRCKADEVAGIVALWADVDFAGGAHKKTNLPPTQDDALALIEAMGLPPTIIVHSGHGLQAWWLLKEPWMFETEEERLEAARLVARWQATLAAKARTRGWAVDATHDLARVLRVPGTWNCKDLKNPVQVTILRADPDQRYNPGDFEPYMLDESEYGVLTAAAAVDASGLVLREDANPPADKLVLLLANDPTFKQTWERTRPDIRDRSPSGWDIALANLAVQAGWSDQEIVDLLIANRKKFGDDLKLDRPDYYARTIGKARAAFEKDRTHVELLNAVEEAAQIAVEDPDKARARILDALSKRLGVRIIRIVKFLTEPPQYRVVTDRGSVLFTSSAALTSQASFRRHIFDATRTWPESMGRKDWDDTVQAIGSALEEEDVGPEATEQGLMQSLVLNYLADQPPAPNHVDGIGSDRPFWKEGQVFIIGSAFRRWVNITEGLKLEARGMGRMLRECGCTPRPVFAVVNGQPTTRYCWIIPQDIVESAGLKAPEAMDEVAADEDAQ